MHVKAHAVHSKLQLNCFQKQIFYNYTHISRKIQVIHHIFASKRNTRRLLNDSSTFDMLAIFIVHKVPVVKRAQTDCAMLQNKIKKFFGNIARGERKFRNTTSAYRFQGNTVFGAHS